MDFGIFDHVEKVRDSTEALQVRLRVAEAADRAGFYCYHLAEHHGSPLSMSPSPNVLLAALSQRTTRIRLGTLCYLLPFYNPLRLLTEICMLDGLSNGRIDVGIGRGVSPVELPFFGVDPKESRAIFEEELEILRLGFTSKSLTYHGKYYDYDDVPMELTTVQQPYPPIWYPTSALPSVGWAAQNRLNVVFLGSTAGVIAQVDAFEENLPDGDKPDDYKVGVLRYVFVAETEAEAFSWARSAYATHLQHKFELPKRRGMMASRAANPDTVGSHEPDPPTLDDAFAKGWAAVGTPEMVVEQLQAMDELSRCNYLVFNPILGDTDVDRALASIELFSEQVAPHF